MDIGIGLPSTVPGAPPDAVLDWARRVDDGPFASLASLDRIVYDNYEPLIALAGAAAVTARVQLATCILIAPLRETLTLAKQLMSLDALSGGRLTVGAAIGARGDDYERSEFAEERRGDRLTRMLTQLRDVWEDPAIGPSGRPRESPRVLVGGGSGPAFARMARLGDGYVHSGGPPRAFARAADQARAAWADQGRPGTPPVWGMAYFALGGAEEAGRDYLLDYYAFTGAFAQRIADGLLATPADVRETVQGYADAGCDHLILFPGVADPLQVDLLAEVVA